MVRSITCRSNRRRHPMSVSSWWPALAGSFLSLARNEALEDETNVTGAARGSMCRTRLRRGGGGGGREGYWCRCWVSFLRVPKQFAPLGSFSTIIWRVCVSFRQFLWLHYQERARHDSPEKSDFDRRFLALSPVSWLFRVRR